MYEVNENFDNMSRRELSDMLGIDFDPNLSHADLVSMAIERSSEQ